MLKWLTFIVNAFKGDFSIAEVMFTIFLTCILASHGYYNKVPETEHLKQ